MSLLSKIAGDFTYEPGAMNLSSGARKLIQQAFSGIGRGVGRDYHVHIAGIGTGGTGCYVNKKMRSWLTPHERLKFLIFANAAGVRNEDRTDEEYLDRLVRLAQDFPIPVKFQLLAFDQFYSEDGKPHPERSQIYAPNDYIWEICRRWPQYFIPCVSIHPYRADALDELEKWAERGVRQVKWLPNAQGMNPSNPRCDRFYETMIRHNMVLLCHAGKEQSINTTGFQKFGNPLFCRRPLDHGLSVIIAHCAGLGTNVDVEDPKKRRRKNFDLFMRLFDEERYEGLLWGDITAIIQSNRSGAPLQTILALQNKHHRITNGSDYPLPAINMVVSTRLLQMRGYITGKERRFLNEIYHRNPLLFDFVVKRTLKHPLSGQRFLSELFFARPELEPERTASGTHHE